MEQPAPAELEYSKYLPRPDDPQYGAVMEKLDDFEARQRRHAGEDPNFPYPNLLEVSKFELQTELPKHEEVTAVNGLRGRIREKRIHRAINMATTGLHDAEVSRLVVTNETKIPRSGWPGTYLTRHEIKDADGNPVRDEFGNKTYRTNEHRPHKLIHRRKSHHASRLALRRGRLGMVRNNLLQYHGVDSPEDKVGIPYGQDRSGKIGWVADIESGARSRELEGPRNRVEKQHIAKMDRRVDRHDARRKFMSWRLRRMAEAPHTRARTQRAANRAVRLTAQQERAALKQKSKHEVRHEMQSWRAYNRSEES